MRGRTPARPGTAEDAGEAVDPYALGLRMLAHRELSVRQLRMRLAARTSRADEVEAAIERLRASGALDDERVARAYARTAAQVKGRGRDRILRELDQMGIARSTARSAMDEVCGADEERDRLQRALARRSRGLDPADPAVARKLYAGLVRQGFDPEAVRRALRAGE